jgi:isoleucyl-tRNA synthetase
VAEEGDLLVALDTQLTPELEAEALAREVAHRLQSMRKAAGYEISDRVAASISGSERLVGRLRPYHEWLADEVLATDLRLGEDGLEGAESHEALEVDAERLDLALRRA